MEVAVRDQGGWRRLGTDVSGVSHGDRVRVTVESENVPSATGLAVRMYADEDGEWDEVQDTITGSPTTIEFDMPGFVTMPLQVWFVACIFEGEECLTADPYDYS